MTAALNISKMLEQAIYQGIVDAGVDPVACFLNFWQVSNPRAAHFPQITGACSPDIPDGTQETAYSMFRLVHCTIKIATATEADEDRAAISALYVKVRTAIDTANAERSTWQTASLIGCQLDAITITDSPVPYIEQLPNGGWVFVMDLNFDCLVSVT